jgi:hypothetical protein
VSALAGESAPWDEADVHPRPRWPKGPFPDKYRFDAVAQRLTGAFEAPERKAALEELRAAGWLPLAANDDPFVRLFEGEAGLDLVALRAQLAPRGLLPFRWSASPRDPALARARLGLVASADPIDAVVAVGVAGPEHGIGTAALVRFLAALRSFAGWEIESLGEDRLELTLRPRNSDAALRIAERALRICPPLKARTTAVALTSEIAREERLELVYR